MKRRGARVVSSSSAVVPDADAVNADVVSPVFAAAVAAVSSPLNVEEATRPALTIPTLNIFARFQSHRDDFDADWLLLKEDPVSGEAKPPLAAHVADKLRRHQAQLGAHRAAAAADRSALRQDAPKKATLVSGGAVAEGMKGLEEYDVTGAVVQPPLPPSPSSRRHRRPDTYDSAEDEVSVTAALEGGAEEIVNGDDDDEYVPEDRKAAQYRTKKATTPTPQSPTVTGGAVLNAASRSVCRASAPVKEETSAEVVVEDTTGEEGLTGDYLTFQSTMPTGVQAVTAGALQATVHMPAISPKSLSSPGASGRSPQLQQQQRRQRGRGPVAGVEDRVVVVPLWSIARMVQHGGYCATNSLIALHQEITDLVDFLRPTEAEVTMRRFIEMEVGRLAGRLWPGSRVLVYGSMYTHLLLPRSDLDMTLLDVPVPVEEALTVLAKEISNEGLCENAYPQVILKTKVPLIKFVHKGSLIDVDISVGAVDGKRNSDCVIRYLNTYPEALPLVLTVKYFLMQRGMHEPYHGGLGSYAATLLVVAFLRQHPIYTTHPEQRSLTGLGKLLVDFLRMCGQFWSYGRVAISLDDLQPSAGGVSAGDFRARSDLDWSCRMQSPVSPTSPRTPLGPAQGSIADPVDAANNAASSLRLFHSISSMFTYAYLALTAEFDTTAAATAGGGSDVPDNLAGGTKVSSPSSNDISCRPTLLSRVFHVDAEMLFHRQAIATTYERLCSEMPAYMDEARRSHREEDAAMLSSNARSWRERRQLQRGGEKPFLWEQQKPRSVTSLEERLALARLHEATPSALSSSSTPATVSGNPWKRLRSGSNEEDKEERGEGREGGGCRREEALSVSSASSGSASSRSRSGYDSDTESNASSVRINVTTEAERSRRMHRS
jgi:hypothetical protein